METIELDDFYSGGYFLLRSGRPDWQSPFGKFLPDGNLVSLSKCICRMRLSVYWGWTPGDREAALKFGIPESKWEEFVDWCGEEYLKQLGRVSMFYNTNAARAFIERFQLATDDLYIIGAGLPKENQQDWIDEEPDNEGVAKRIKQGLPLEQSGKPLGYDVVSYAYTDFSHSWLCSHLEHEMHELFWVRANNNGLIDNYTDAKKLYDWIAEDDGKGVRAEPEPYDFWLVLSYPLTVE